MKILLNFGLTSKSNPVVHWVALAVISHLSTLNQPLPENTGDETSNAFNMLISSEKDPFEARESYKIFYWVCSWVVIVLNCNTTHALYETNKLYCTLETTPNVYSKQPKMKSLIPKVLKYDLHYAEAGGDF